ncbi:MAG: 4Fe-4S dicluster domain-containing protein [Deltaproteobacteria bacterium]|nr:4Fe-4S dicluster domain-containing protein [Deltaproteobacteria bacterium]
MASDKETIVVNEQDLSFAREVAAQPGGEHIWRCFACGTCVAGCPMSEVEPGYSPRKIIRQILFGMRDEVLSSPMIWYCLICYRCYARCPQKVNFTDIMRVLRYLAVKGGYVQASVMDRCDSIDKLTNSVRRELVKRGFESGQDAFDQFREKVEAELGGLAT